MKKLIAGAAALLLLGGASSPAHAKEPNEVTYTLQDDGSLLAQYQYTSVKEENTYQWTPEIIWEGERYLLDSEKTSEQMEEMNVTDMTELKEVVTYENLEEESVPETYEVEFAGESFSLLLTGEVEYLPVEVEDGTVSLTGNKNYGFSIEPPQAANSIDVAYEENGFKKTAPASFTGFTTSSEKWDSGYELRATFIGDEDVKYYMLDDTKIENKGNDVPIAGHEELLIKHLGLDSATTRIDSAKWDGKPKTVDGSTVRYAKLSCSRKGREYTANYSASVPSKKIVYTAVATYELKDVEIESEDVEYSISTSAVYNLRVGEEEKEGPGVLMISAITILVLLAFGAVVWFLIKRRKHQNDL